MSVANETRERTIRELERPLGEMPIKDLATLTGEGKFLVDLSLRLGMPMDTLLDALWSSDVTSYRAAALVEAAAMEIAQEFAEREATRQQGRFGRRRR